ncbi:prepilin-type N-terminal cleavage/methylation domain-containing protein [Halomonas sp. BMC6]|uniref:PilW family protein n=1 Tax=Halomonas sp. BMC6 TaxID=3073244 RepID=UPI0030D19BA8
MTARRQVGAGLVELMVAMAIGTVIALGAGQLFLSTFSTFSAVDELSRKQEVVVFLSQILAEELRDSGDTGRYTLSCSLSGAQCRCTISDTEEENQPVIDFDKAFEEGYSISDAECSEDQEPLASVAQHSIYQYVVNVPLMAGGALLTFHVTDRDVVTANNPLSE